MTDWTRPRPAFSLALALFATVACEKDSPTTTPPDAPPPATQAAGDEAKEPAPELVDTWYNDLDGDGVPDFVELELHSDPNLDECIVEACGPGARGGRLVDKINTLIVLDASGSMAGKVGKKTKMDAAKAAVRRYVEVMPASEVMQVGVMVYGHVGDNTPAKKDESCAAVEMKVPMGAVDPKAVGAALTPLKATGWSPIARALEASSEVLPEQVSAVNHVILVADGLERCDGDPAAIARRLRATNHLAVVDVVGFGELAQEDSAALRAIADATGGLYVDAASVADFDQALNLLTLNIWDRYDAWLCAVGSAPLLACYDKRADEAIARAEAEVERMAGYRDADPQIASLGEIKARIEATRDGRRRVVTTYQVKLEAMTKEGAARRKKAGIKAQG
ncbi:MAG: VWA domain-containing protein [Nannocystaceae bacterium]